MRVSKWIELNSGELVNLDMIYAVTRINERIYQGETYSVKYFETESAGFSQFSENYENESERDKRFEEIKEMLLRGDK